MVFYKPVYLFIIMNKNQLVNYLLKKTWFF
jgi:hypothetical protein